MEPSDSVLAWALYAAGLNGFEHGFAEAFNEEEGGGEGHGEEDGFPPGYKEEEERQHGNGANQREERDGDGEEGNGKSEERVESEGLPPHLGHGEIEDGMDVGECEAKVELHEDFRFQKL